MHHTSSASGAAVHHRTRRFIALEWLRFILGLYIVIFHTLHYYPSIASWSGYVTGLGFFATSTFFILSGFLLTHVYLRPQGDEKHYALRESKRSFWIRRWANLYPIHIGAMVITIIVMVLLPIFQLAPEDNAASIRAVMLDVNNGDVIWHTMTNSELFMAAIENITLLQAWNPYYLTFNPPTWSISTLFFFYLVFPWLAVWLWQRRYPFAWLLGVNALYLVPPMLAILLTSWGAPETGLLHRNPIIRLPEFAAGILLCVWYHRCARQTLSRRTAGTLIVGIVGSIVLGEWLLLPDHSAGWRYVLHNGLMMPAQLAIIYLCLFVKWPTRVFWQHLAARLGGASLPMFALHVPLYLIFSRLEMALTGWISGQSDSAVGAGGNGQAGHVALVGYPLFLVVTVVVCIVFQEQFVLRVRNVIQACLLKKL